MISMVLANIEHLVNVRVCSKQSVRFNLINAYNLLMWLVFPQRSNELQKGQ